MIVNGQLLPQYIIEYRKHFTNYHATVVKVAGGIQIGATECCLIMYGLQFMFAAFSDTNTSCAAEFDIQKSLGLPFELTLTLGDMIAVNTFVLSMQHNCTNFYEGYKMSTDKTYAIMCMIPYF